MALGRLVGLTPLGVWTVGATPSLFPVAVAWVAGLYLASLACPTGLEGPGLTARRIALRLGWIVCLFAGGGGGGALLLFPALWLMTAAAIGVLGLLRTERLVLRTSLG
jgi:hypothetical protein